MRTKKVRLPWDSNMKAVLQGPLHPTHLLKPNFNIFGNVKAVYKMREKAAASSVCSTCMERAADLVWVLDALLNFPGLQPQKPHIRSTEVVDDILLNLCCLTYVVVFVLYISLSLFQSSM